jgi:hypothetical protein
MSPRLYMERYTEMITVNVGFQLTGRLLAVVIGNSRLVLERVQCGLIRAGILLPLWD